MAQKTLLIKRGVLPISHVDNACVLGYNVGMITNGLPAPLNITLVGGREKVVEMQVSEPNGAFRDMSYYTFSGKAEGVDGKEYAIEAWVDGGSPDVMIMRFPALPDGRYKWAITAEAEDGTACALVSGTLGVQWPQIKSMEGAVASPNRRVVVRYPEDSKAGIARWVSTSWLDAAVETALDAEKGAREAADELLVVNDKLAQAEALKQAFDGKISEFVQPNAATGTWVVGGKDTGKPYKGADGKNADVIKRYEISSVAELPPTGNDGAFYYVKQEATRATGWVRLTTSPGPVGAYVMSIAGVRIYCPSDMSVESIAAAINAAQRYVTASVRESDSTYIDLESTVLGELGNTVSLELGENLNNQQISGASMTGGKDEGYIPYVWLEKAGGGSWQAVSTTPEKIAADVATVSKYGTVMLSYSVSASEGGKVPINDAVLRYVDAAVADKVTRADIEDFAYKYELEDLATKAELEPLATEQYVDQAVAEVSETTYSKSETDEHFVSKADAEELYIRWNAGYPPVQVITRKAFDALPVRDPSVIYYIVKEK